MPATEELEVLLDVVRRLEKAGMPYMVTGAIAANFYAVPRMTRDIDVVIELSDRDVDRFIGLFQEDFYLEPETVRAATRDKAMFNLIHNEYVLKIDFVVRKDSDYRRKEFSRRQKISVDNRSFYVVTPEDLILSKLDWAKDSQSEVQLSDVRNLLKSVRGLNRRYLARWAKRLGVESLYRRVMI